MYPPTLPPAYIGGEIDIKTETRIAIANKLGRFDLMPDLRNYLSLVFYGWNNECFTYLPLFSKKSWYKQNIEWIRSTFSRLGNTKQLLLNINDLHSLILSKSFFQLNHHPFRLSQRLKDVGVACTSFKEFRMDTLDRIMNNIVTKHQTQVRRRCTK
jgi:hypothetical protein